MIICVILKVNCIEAPPHGHFNSNISLLYDKIKGLLICVALGGGGGGVVLYVVALSRLAVSCTRSARAGRSRTGLFLRSVWWQHGGWCRGSNGRVQSQDSGFNSCVLTYRTDGTVIFSEWLRARTSSEILISHESSTLRRKKCLTGNAWWINITPSYVLRFSIFAFVGGNKEKSPFCNVACWNPACCLFTWECESAPVFSTAVTGRFFPIPRTPSLCCEALRSFKRL